MSRRDQVREALVECGVVQENDKLISQIAEEVEHALYPPKHEQKVTGYGSIVVTKPLSAKIASLDVRNLSAEIARQLADGVSTFSVVHKKLVRIMLRTASCVEELDLIELHRETKGILIHRNHHGVVRVFKDDAIYIHESGVWMTRPYARSILAKVENAVPQADSWKMDRILQFAFHVLSPWNVGATLVWWINERKRAPKVGLDISASGMYATDKGHYGALRSILRQYDGALLISPNGQVQSIGYHLKYTKKAEKFIKQVRGTRHTSAKRYSFDQASAVVFVVSEDGPVSVFSDGAKVTELVQVTAVQTARELRNLVPAKASDVEAYNQLVKCPKCGKKITVEIIIVYGLRERETGDCPICGTELHSQMCWQINTRLVKVLPHETDLDHMIEQFIRSRD